MKKINNLASIGGRFLIVKIFKELRFDKQVSSISALFTLWKLCTYEKELFRYSSQEVAVLRPLGFFKGTGLWLEEIVNRFYYSSINSFVYLGAAVLLVLVGIRRFSDYIDDNVVIAGVIFESLMLIMLFTVMYHTPMELVDNPDSEDSSQESLEELLLEVGEISTDFATVSVSFERLNDSFQKLVTLQQELIAKIDENTKLNLQAVNPNPQMLEIMAKTNENLLQFNSNIQELNQSIEKVKAEEIELAVKNELNKIINKISSNSSI